MDPDAAVDGALGAAFPDRSVADVEAVGPSWHDDTRTVRVAFDDGGTAYLKVAVDGDGARVAREAAVLRFVAADRDTRVPRVLAVDPAGDPPCLATAPLEGAPLDARDRSAALVRRVGWTLGGVHEAAFDAHGTVTGGGADDLDVERAPWPEVLRDRIGRMRRRAPADRFPDHFERVAEAVDAHRERLVDAPATLVHGDPAAPNCVVWEEAHVGDPARDLHRARDQHVGPAPPDRAERLVAALHAGYRERTGALPDGFAERRPVYDAVRYLGRSGYVERYAAWHGVDPDAFAAEVDREMERRLRRLERR